MIDVSNVVYNQFKINKFIIVHKAKQQNLDINNQLKTRKKKIPQ